MVSSQKSTNEPGLPELSAVLKLFTVPETADLESEFNEKLQEVNKKLAHDLKSKFKTIDVVQYFLKRATDILGNVKILEILGMSENNNSVCILSI